MGYLYTAQVVMGWWEMGLCLCRPGFLRLVERGATCPGCLRIVMRRATLMRLGLAPVHRGVKRMELLWDGYFKRRPRVLVKNRLQEDDDTR